MNKWDLLHIGTAYVEVHTFKWNDYVTVRDFSTTTNALSKEVLELEEENKKLKSDLSECECSMHFENDEVWYRKRECKKLKEEKEFFYKSAKQFREDSESWRKECERLLWLQICWKTIAERIEDDKKVVRE